MVRPGGVGNVNGAVGASDLVETGQEECAEMHGTGAGNRLYGGGALLGQGGRVAAEDQLDGFAGEGGEAGDGEVFVVEVGVIAEDLVSLASVESSQRAVLEWYRMYSIVPKTAVPVVRATLMAGCYA